MKQALSPAVLVKCHAVMCNKPGCSAAHPPRPRWTPPSHCRSTQACSSHGHANLL